MICRDKINEPCVRRRSMPYEKNIFLNDVKISKSVIKKTSRKSLTKIDSCNHKHVWKKIVQYFYCTVSS